MRFAASKTLLVIIACALLIFSRKASKLKNNIHVMTQ